VRMRRSRHETSPKDPSRKEAALALPFAQVPIIGEAGCSGSKGKGGRLRMIGIERDAMADQHSGRLPRIHRLGDAIQQRLVFRRALQPPTAAASPPTPPSA